MISTISGRTLVTLNQVSKSYPKVSSGRSRFAALKSALLKQPYEATHDIIQAIDLRIEQGQSLGIIGENGAGKSTLLKLIAGVLQPTSGSLSVDCRMAALLELGAGFHPEYSGIDNIRMNAALSGLSADALQAKMQAIIDFADIGGYIHEPIKHYSSGMVVRLGFAMMTALEPELLITDEVLAVGDESFQKKCIAWMQAYLDNGGTLLLCSHGMYHIQKLCQQAIWVENGRIREYGDALAVTQAYINHHARKNAAKPATHTSNDSYAVKTLNVYDDNHQLIRVANYRQTLIVKGEIYSPDGREPTVAIGIVSVDGTPIFGINNTMSGGRLRRVNDTLFAFCLRYPHCPLLPGAFIVKAHAMDPEALRLLDTVETELTVQGNIKALGHIFMEHEWHN